MSSAVTSLNQSTESAVSSTQRSGLNISVGDTKSIVLALQALQSKIRALENDRDYHQDQYEQAMRTHEAYKQNMQRQAELERAAHHKRERELLEELRKAQDENAQLQNALNGRRDRETSDLSSLRMEVEAAVLREKHSAEERESKLRSEIERLQREIDAQKHKEEEIHLSLESLRSERDGVQQTNMQLRRAMDELLSTFEREKEPNENEHEHEHELRKKQEQEQHEEQERFKQNCCDDYYNAIKPTRAVSARIANRKRSMENARMQSAQTNSPRSHVRQPWSRSRSISKGNYSEMTWNSYRDPTCNSMLRDVRNVNGLGLCRTHTPTLQRETKMHIIKSQNANMSKLSNENGKFNNYKNNYSSHTGNNNNKNNVISNTNISSYRGYKSTEQNASMHPKVNNVNNTNYNIPYHQHESVNDRNKFDRYVERESYRQTPERGKTELHNIREKNVSAVNGTKNTLQANGFGAVNTVEAELRCELNELHAQYRDTIARGAAEEIPNDVLTGALSHISRLIDHKVEQLRLINDAQRELSVISASHGRSFMSSEREVDAIDKSTQRTLLMNEIREMLAKTAKAV